MIDYLEAISTESARFADLVSSASNQTRVPSCPDWSIADLTWHLTEVQHFWASIVSDLLDSPEGVGDLARPADDELADLFDAQSARLLEAVSERDPTDICWSWHDAGHNVGWVRRRQAHEALIHRIDAELASDGPCEVHSTLAADGVDEVLTVMLDATDLPDWATFHPDGTSAVLEITDIPRSWAVELGRFSGTSPDSGNTYDDPALCLAAAASDPDAALRGRARDMDLWLWGRDGGGQPDSRRCRRRHPVRTESQGFDRVQIPSSSSMRLISSSLATESP